MTEIRDNPQNPASAPSGGGQQPTLREQRHQVLHKCKEAFVEFFKSVIEYCEQLRYESWARKKSIQICIRRHLSHWLALALAVGVLWRERDALWGMLMEIPMLSWVLSLIVIAGTCILGLYIRDLLPSRARMPFAGHVLHVIVLLGYGLTLWYMRAEIAVAWGYLRAVPGILWFILLLTLGTILAGVWEFSGNKLSTSPQDVKFVYTIRGLLFDLEKFCYGLDRTEDPNKRLDDFVQGLVNATAQTFYDYRRADAGFLTNLRDKAVLKLEKWSPNANFDRDLSIPIPPAEQPGAAGVSLHLSQLVYVPFVQRREAWPFSWDQDAAEWRPSPPWRAWVKPSRPEYEAFASNLCVPVARYHQTRENGGIERVQYGVLNVSTKARDPFVDRDFLMTECFASILALAFAFSKAEGRA